MKNVGIAQCRGELVRHSQRAGRADFRQQHDKFLAAVARNDIARASDRVDQQLRQLAQAGVALRMATMIVVGLEMIDIDHQQRQWRAGAAAAPPFALERDIETAPVGDASHRVGRQQLAHHQALRILHALAALQGVGGGIAKAVAKRDPQQPEIDLLGGERSAVELHPPDRGDGRIEGGEGDSHGQTERKIEVDDEQRGDHQRQPVVGHRRLQRHGGETGRHGYDARGEKTGFQRLRRFHAQQYRRGDARDHHRDHRRQEPNQLAVAAEMADEAADHYQHASGGDEAHQHQYAAPVVLKSAFSERPLGVRINQARGPARHRDRGQFRPRAVPPFGCISLRVYQR
jgi:hypothetical protein